MDEFVFVIDKVILFFVFCVLFFLVNCYDLIVLYLLNDNILGINVWLFMFESL